MILVHDGKASDLIIQHALHRIRDGLFRVRELNLLGHHLGDLRLLQQVYAVLLRKFDDGGKHRF